MAWNQPASDNSNTARKASKSSPSLVKGVIAGCVVVVAGVFIFSMIRMSNPLRDAPVKSTDTSTNKEAPLATKKSTAFTQQTVETVSQQEEECERGFQKIGNKRGTLVSATTNQNGYITEIWKLSNGKTLKNIRTQPPIFRHTTDQLLSALLSNDGNRELPPLPDLNAKALDEEFRKSIADPIRIEESDTDRVKELKSAVIAGRRRVAELMANGMTFADVVLEHRADVNEHAKNRADAIRDIQRILSEGDEKGARAYRDAMNKAFEKMGVDTINMAIGEREKAERTERKRVNK